MLKPPALPGDTYQEAASDGAFARGKAKAEAPPLGLCIDTGQELKCHPWLVKGVIPQRGTGLLIGQSGTAKTAIAIRLGIVCAAFGEYADAKGEPLTFFGRRIKERVGVLYPAAEGEGEIAHRVRAAKEKLGITGEIPFAWWTKQVLNGAASLTDKEGRSAFVAFCKRAKEWMRRRFGVRLGIVIIDTAAQAYTIEDENSGPEITALAKDFGAMMKELDCFGLIVVHAGKDAQKFARGTLAWRDNFDVALMASGDRDNVEDTCKNRRLTLSKNRFGREGPITAFDVESHVLGQDEDGDDFDAVVIVETDAPAKPAKSSRPEKRPRGQRAEFLKAVEWAINEKGDIMPGAGCQPLNTKGVRRGDLKRYVLQKGFLENLEPESQRTKLNTLIRGMAGDGYFH
jgi:hypothetical protein